MRTPRFAEVLIVALLGVLYAVAPASAGGVDVLERGRVLRLLDQLGVTTNGVYTEPVAAIGGTSGQWAVDASGDLVPATNNVDDIGDGTFNPRTVRASTSVVTPALYVEDGAGNYLDMDAAGVQIAHSAGIAIGQPGQATTFAGVQVLTEAAAPGTPAVGKVAIYAKTDGLLYGKDDAGTETQISNAAGGVVGPASATDNAVARFDSTTGKLIQNSAVTIADTTGDITTPGSVTLGADVDLSRSAANQLQLGTAAAGRDALIAGNGFFSDPFGGSDYVKVWIDPTQGVLLGLNKQVKWDGGQADSGTPDVGLGRNAAGVLTVTNGSTGSGILRAGVCLGRLKGANFNATTDQAIPINSSRYVVRKIVVNNASISLTTAAGGVYTAASKGGTALVAAGQVYSALTAATKFVDLTLEAVAGTDVVTATTLYLSLTTAQGAAATADIYVYGDALP